MARRRRIVRKVRSAARAAGGQFKRAATRVRSAGARVVTRYRTRVKVVRRRSGVRRGAANMRLLMGIGGVALGYYMGEHLAAQLRSWLPATMQRWAGVLAALLVALLTQRFGRRQDIKSLGYGAAVGILAQPTGVRALMPAAGSTTTTPTLPNVQGATTTVASTYRAALPAPRGVGYRSTANKAAMAYLENTP